MKFGDKLLHLRKENKMTQEELAEKLKVTRQTISNWELGETKPDIEQLKEMSKLYKVSLDELMDNGLKEVLTEKVTNVEKLAGLIYKIVKVLLFIFLGVFVLIMVAIVSFSFRRATPLTHESITEATINCHLNGEDYTYYIKYGDNNRIIEAGGNGELINILDLDKYSYQDQVFDKIKAYIKNNGGTCE